MDDLLTLVDADPCLAPPPIMAALAGLAACRRDLANGGMDQFVWNHGGPRTREIAAAWRMVGAVENSELLVALADALERQSPPSGADEVVDAFHRFRAEMGGPAFDVPEPDDELEEALLEWALEHPERFPPAD